eukprot:CAMPEP_0185751144 /NCGR_PEP_ID=MMETSP1174-20130828/9898_1 /TAXON_ID=35687 /ORGANISM="Dictyocha speculum, Strain CCMP1381" /LENGTH=123 /DNA_ID=CAMNT_0028427985 /DNA_START=98 /DNA_END=469 /DNA_ORIENTATION=-
MENKLNGLQTWVGVSRTQALEMVLSYPKIVGVNAERTVGPAAQFLLLHNENITVSYLAEHPRVLTRSLERCLQPRVERLNEIGKKQWAPTSLVSLSDRGFQEKYGRLGDPPPPEKKNADKTPD